MADTSQIANQFRGLPMGDLIGAPLIAACEAELRLANSTADFIKVIGFEPPEKDGDPVTKVRNVQFKFTRPQSEQTPEAIQKGVLATEEVELDVPLLSIIKVPNLFVNAVDITFDMEVKNTEASQSSSDSSATLKGEAKVGWGIFSASVSVSGSVSSHEQHTRSSDQSAKYHVEVHAKDDGMPEGLARVMDMMAQSIAPKTITKSTPAPTP